MKNLYIYKKDGSLVETVENATKDQIKSKGLEIHTFNKEAESADMRFMAYDTQWPIPSKKVDPTDGSLILKSLTERVSAGEMEVPEGTKVVGENFQKMTDQEKLDDDPAKHFPDYNADDYHIVDGILQLKTDQDKLDADQITVEEVYEKNLKRLKQEVEDSFIESVTSPGKYSLSVNSRIKAAATAPYRSLANDDAAKAPLLASKLIYPDDIYDEIISHVGTLQTAYDSAKSAIQALRDGNNQDVSAYEAVGIGDYL